jgi:hypothetical protein
LLHLVCYRHSPPPKKLLNEWAPKHVT